MPKSAWLCEHCGEVFTTEKACTEHEAVKHRPGSVEERLAVLETEVARLREAQPIFRVGGNMPQWIMPNRIPGVLHLPIPTLPPPAVAPFAEPWVETICRSAEQPRC